MSHELSFEGRIDSKTIVLVINPLDTYWSYQLTSEIALRAREKSENVFWLNVAVRQKSKYQVNKHDHISKLKFKNPSKKLRKILTDNGVQVVTKVSNFKNTFKMPKFESVMELRKYRLDGLNLGAIIFSAISSAKHTTSFTIRDIEEDINHFLYSSLRARDEIESFISIQKPDLILTINDRLIGSSLGVTLANKHNVESKIIYWGSNPNSIEEYGTSLYDSSEWQEKISTKWQVSPPDRSATELLDVKVRDLATNPSSDSRQYLGTQVQGLTIQKKRKTCVFYAQSEHEHSPNFIPDTQGRFQNQYTAFAALQEVAKEFDHDLVLKHHPHKMGKPSHSRNLSGGSLDWQSVKIDSCVQQIAPDSKIDTYALLSEADINVIWSSTVGLECIARRKSVLVLGKPHWLDLNWGIHAWSVNNLRNAFQSEQTCLEPNKLFPWFWYLSDYGSKTRYADTGKSLLRISGEEIFIPTLLYRAAQSFRSLHKLYFKS